MLNRRHIRYCAYMTIALMTTNLLAGCAFLKQWRADSQAQELEETFSEMAKQRTEDGVPAWTVDVVDGGNVRLVMRAMFASDVATLRPRARDRLDPIITNLKQHPKNTISIFGHADDQSDKDYNYRLSVQRARTVAHYLATHGVESRRIVKVEGRGETQPIASNATPAGRAKNRRVAIFVILPAPSLF
ncbi:MAG: OmpA family protein [Sinobacteraceae bacterium]|nr:OmpA family protein [Nevskiaceae bacterium]